MSCSEAFHWFHNCRRFGAVCRGQYMNTVSGWSVWICTCTMLPTTATPWLSAWYVMAELVVECMLASVGALHDLLLYPRDAWRWIVLYVRWVVARASCPGSVHRHLFQTTLYVATIRLHPWLDRSVTVRGTSSMQSSAVYPCIRCRTSVSIIWR
jgi:hypothetical protein